MPREERQAGTRQLPEQRVMHALNFAPDGRMFRHALRTVTGLDEAKIAPVIRSLARRGVVRTPSLVEVELVW